MERTPLKSNNAWRINVLSELLDILRRSVKIYDPFFGVSRFYIGMTGFEARAEEYLADSKVDECDRAYLKEILESVRRENESTRREGAEYVKMKLLELKC